MILLFFFQVVGIMFSVLLSDDLSTILKTPKHSSTLCATTSATKGSSAFPIRLPHNPMWVRHLFWWGWLPKFVRTFIAIVVIVVSNFVIIYSNTHVCIARMIDENGRYVHEDASIVPINLDAVRTSRASCPDRIRRHDQLSFCEILRGIDPQSVIARCFNNLHNAFISFVTGKLFFGPLVFFIFLLTTVQLPMKNKP